MTEEIIEKDILSCYGFLAHEKQTELRFLDPNNREEPARSLFVSTKEEFLQFCQINNGNCNIYAGINERNFTGTRKEEVIAVKTIVIDIDAIKPKGEAATEEELKKAEIMADKIIAWFLEMGFCQPSKTMSGNGYQLWCAIPKIIIDDTNRDTTENQIKAFYKLLIKSFSGQEAQIDNIGDLPRIIKVIGTKSVKGIETKERPHRASFACGEFKRQEDQKLKEFILQLNAEESKLKEIKEKKTEDAKLTLEMAMQFDKKLTDLYLGNLNSQYKSRSEAELALLCKLVWWTFSEAEIRRIMSKSRIGKWTDKLTTEHYQDWQIKKAYDFITETRQVQKNYPEEETESKIKEKPPVQCSKFELKTYLDFEKMKKDKRFLIEDMLYPRTVNMLFSPPAQFKSIIALHLAMQVACGKKFLGLKTTKTPVLLCDKENNDQLIKNRLQQLRLGQKIRSKRFPLYILSRNGDLFDPIFIENIEKAIREKGIKLIVFDTLHRFADYEENSADEINRIYTNIFQPLTETYDCSILFLHHTTKDGEYRGSSDLLGMIDTAYSVKRQNKENFALECRKSRFGEIETLCGQIVFGEKAWAVLRLDEEVQDMGGKAKFMDAVQEIISLFSIKEDSLERSFIAAELQIRKEQQGCVLGIRTMDKALKWLVKKGKLEKRGGKYARKWLGEFNWD